MSCLSGCTGDVGSLLYQCTDFDAIEDWTTGRYTVRYTPSVSVFSFGYAGCCWISTLMVGADSSWSFKASVDLTLRSDTGLINRSPTVEMAPVVALLRGCDYVISLPVGDVDGDIVRCRWANAADECSGVCNAFANAILDQTACTISYSARQGGYFAVALQIEDFANTASTVPLSSIPLQFLVHVITCSGCTCESEPEFVEPTSDSNDCFAIEVGDRFNLTLKARSKWSLRSLTTISPIGMVRSNVEHISDNVWNYLSVNVSWIPTQTDSGRDHSLCYYATDNNLGLSNVIRCIKIPVSVKEPTPLRVERQGISNTWIIVIDQTFNRPTNSAFITMYESENNTAIISIDVSTSSDVIYDPINRRISVTFNYVFDIDKKYHVSIPSGLVEGYVSCGAVSHAINDSSFWPIELNCGDIFLDNGHVDPENETSYPSTVTYMCDPGHFLVGDENRTCQSNRLWTGTNSTCKPKDCGSFNTPANGQASTSITLYNTHVHFTCYFGYRINGNITIICTEDGTWSNNPPTCEVVDCDIPPTLLNGAYTTPNGTTYLQTATFSCNNGYDFVGTSDRQCLVNGSWSSVHQFCMIKDCGPLVSPQNGNVLVGNTTYGEIATYTCDFGHALIGNNSRDCLGSGQWSDSEPTCVLKDCGTLPDTPQGSVYTPFTTYGAFALYDCQKGYHIEGSKTRQCQVNERWSSPVPTCILTDCGNLTSPINGDVLYTATLFDDCATYSCNDGYEVVGERRVCCQENATWTSMDTVCIIKDCGPLYNPDDGRVIYSNTTYGSQATFECDVGYEGVGASQIVCLSNASWSESSPFCRIKDCYSPSVLTNGSASFTNTTYQSVCVYSCDTGFDLIGDNISICLQDGNWSSPYTYCHIKDCGLVLSPENGHAHLDTTYFESIVKYSCNIGYDLTGAQSRECLFNGTWSREDPLCTIRECGHLVHPVNGTVSYSNMTYGATAFYVCETGNDLIGDDKTECLSNGSWSELPPVCYIKDCFDPHEPSNGTVTYVSTTYGSHSQYKCDNGFDLIGGSISTCTAHGNWSDPEIFCQIKDCGHPVSPKNGNVAYEDTKFQAIAQYTCDTGYSLIGNNLRICNKDGMWSDQPYCQIKECGHLVHPVNGTVSYSNMTYGATAFYVCETGYDLIGDDKTECLSNGSWSEPPPACYIKDCFDPHEPSNGTVTYVSTTYGSHSQYKCDDGFDLIGGFLSTCTAHGNWSDPEIFCQIKDCNELEEPANGKFVRNGTTYESVGVFYCKNGYDLIGDDTVYCQDSGEWNGTTPLCKIRECPVPDGINNGLVNYTAHEFMSVVAYECYPGYVLVGDATRTCESNGNWSSVHPVCTIKDCGQPLIPTNGSGEYNTTTYGSQLVYYCDPGFDANSNDSSLCTENGTWSTSNIQCLIKDCGPISPPTNGTVEISDTVYRSSAMFNCDLGYTLHGNNTAECLEDGQWSYGGPSCEIKDCGPVEEFSNGNAIQAEGTTYGARVWFTCNDGYTFAGNDTTSCTYTGEWDSKVPFCQKIESSVAVVVGVIGGIVGLLFLIVTVILAVFMVRKFSMNGHRRLDGDQLEERDYNGPKSTATNPLYSDKCPVPDGINNGLVNFTAHEFMSVVAYECYPGYVLGMRPGHVKAMETGAVFALSSIRVSNTIWRTNKIGVKILIHFRISWRRSGGHSCDDNTISSGSLIGSGTMSCLSGCTGDVGSLLYQCTDYDATEDWTTGRYTVRYTPSVSVFSFGYSACCWISTLIVGADSSWSFKASVDLTLRSDTGLINRSPTVEMAPVVALLRGCDYVISLPVGDVDGDIVRCRWANAADECSGVCNAFANAILDQTACTISYSARQGGYFAVAFQIEDFANTASTVPLSSIPLQFLVHVITCSGCTCESEPEFVEPTSDANDCFAIEVGDRFNLTLKARSKWPLRSLTTISPIGMVRSNVEHTSDNVWNYLSVNVSWIPTQTDSGRDHSLCYYATDNNLGLSNVIRCIKIPVSVKEPTPLRVERQGISNTWIIVIDQTFNRPTNSAFITMYESENNTAIISIDVSTSSDVIYDPINRRISVTFNYVFDIDKKYHVSIPSGLVKGYVSCGAVSHAINDSSFWPIELNCGDIFLDNGHVDTSYPSTLTYICDPGHFLVGDENRTCQSNRLWTGTNSTCKPKDCGSFNTPANGQASTSITLYNTHVHFTCYFGYRINGNITIICTEDGTWSNNPPTCEVVDCDIPPPLLNGAYTTPNGTTYLQTATFSCNNGYDFVGTSDRQCLVNGSWSSVHQFCMIKDCGPLVSPQNGNVLVGNTTYGEIATYTCDFGHALIGNNSRDCLGSGQWSDSEPTCVLKDCGTLPDPPQGSVYTPFTTYGAFALYDCQKGYHIEGSKTRQCQVNERWSSPVPTCILTDCGNLTSPINGDVLYTATLFDDCATYSCNDGYEVVGERRVCCQENATWTSMDTVCIIKDCGPLYNPDDGRVIYSNTTYGSQATFECDVGYEGVGASQIVCLSNASWSESSPFCRIKDCYSPSVPTNGSASFTNTTYQSVCVYSCDTGFDLIGDNISICLQDGNWSSPYTYCHIKDCGLVLSPENGHAHVDTTYFESVVQYSCNIGYDLTGAQSRECLFNGTWSREDPLCTIRECGHLVHPVNGTVSYSNMTYGATAFYVCETGYDLIGDDTTECLSNGSWSELPPVCYIKDCFDPHEPSNGTVTYFSTTYGSHSQYKCDNRFDLIGGSISTCTAHGNWSDPEIFCQIKDCGHPVSPKNGNVAYEDTEFQAIAQYTCDTGYSLIGNNLRICNKDGMWSDQPYCQIKECGHLVHPVNGTVSYSNMTYGATAFYVCETGYDLIGDDKTECLSNGSWSEPPPACYIKDCFDPHKPSNGTVMYVSTTYESHSQYKCDDGFDLIGGSLSTCTAHGNWSDPEIFCQIKDCNELEEQANGKFVRNGTTYESVGVFYCKNGYDLIGDDTVYCQDSGEWNGTTPLCKIRECPVPDGINNGLVNYTAHEFMSVVAYECYPGYVLVGDATRTCESNGNWSSVHPVCTIKDCGQPLIPTNGSGEYNTTTYGSQLVYNCDPGFDANSNDSSLCTENGTWSTSNIQCLIKDCGPISLPTNGTVEISDTVYRSTAMFNCDLGYTLHGNNTAECLEDGQWSYGGPSCEIKDCGPVEEFSNGNAIQAEGTTYGARVWFTCNDGYTFAGNDTTSCTYTGEWDSKVPFCQKIESSVAVVGGVIGGIVGLVFLILTVILAVFMVRKFSMNGHTRLDGDQLEERDCNGPKSTATNPLYSDSSL
ncbi:sushi, von Willebrand factor type A, EGF and pentraxin domain-containing protein 1-like [Mya arenaria]|uniref:sushi, von Willebrand factor type A, EGF and pentraxin domain-containing protein 1-like n=1 Tax=Mya arenaria TaxID=6604 RepID=UPI0022E884D5|nr:sushi, von Willebrand factor type A, EGF and pentraxin domain-containing protein 1-like [Mya arenaria]